MATIGGIATTVATGTLVMTMAAAPAMAAVDYSVYSAGDYAGQIYQWTGNGTGGIITSNTYYAVSYDSDTASLVKASTSTDGWTNCIQNKVLVLDASSSSATFNGNASYVWDHQNLPIRGLVVTADASASYLVGNSTNQRGLILGDANKTSHTIIEKDFTINTLGGNTSYISLVGTQEWQLGGKLTLISKKNISLNGDLTIKSGSAEMQNMLELAADSDLALDTGSSLTMAGLQLAEDSSITNKGTLTIAGDVQTGGFTLTLEENGNSYLHKAITGGELVKTGTGTLELGNGSTTLGTGMGAITVKGGTLSLNLGNNTYDGKLTLEDGVKVIQKNGGVILTGGVSLAGNISFSGNAAGAQTLRLSSGVSGQAGTVVTLNQAYDAVNPYLIYFGQENSYAGTWNVAGKVTLLAEHAKAFEDATVSLNHADAFLKVDTPVARVGALTGADGTVTRDLADTVEIELLTAKDSTYGGTFMPGVGIIMSGAAVQTLDSVSYWGNLTVNSGTLNILKSLDAQDNDSTVASLYRTITLANKATLKTDLILNGGTLALDLSGAAADAASLGGKVLTLNEGTLTGLNLVLADDVQTGDSFTLLQDIASLGGNTNLTNATVGDYFDVGTVQIVSSQVGSAAAVLRPDVTAERLERSTLSFADGELKLTLAEAILNADPLYWDPRDTNGVAADNGTGNWLGANWSPEGNMGKDPGKMAEDWLGSVVFTNQENIAANAQTVGTVTIDTAAVVNNLTVESGSYTFATSTATDAGLTVEGVLSVAAGATANIQPDIDAYQVEVEGSLSAGTISLGKTDADDTVSAGSLTAEAGSVLSVTAVEGEGSVSINGATAAGVFAGREATAGDSGMSVTVNGATVATGTSLSISNAGLGGTIRNSGGLTFSGNMDVLAGMQGVDKSTYSTSTDMSEKGSADADGYLTINKEYTLADGAGTVSNTANWTIAGNSTGVYLSEDGKKVSMVQEKNLTAYWVNNSVTQSTADLHATTTKFVLNGGTLTLDGESFAVETNNNSEQQPTLPGSGAKDTESVIVLTGKLNAADLTVHSGTSVVLQGSGTYDLGTATAPAAGISGFADSTGWSGTVSTAAGSFSDFSKLGNANSAIELREAVTYTGGAQAKPVGTLRFRKGLTLGSAANAASLQAGAVEMSTLVFGHLNSTLAAGKLLSSSLDIVMSDGTLSGLTTGDTLQLVTVADAGALPTLSFNGEADCTYGDSASKYSYTISWEDLAEVMSGANTGKMVLLTTTQNPDYIKEKLEPTDENSSAGTDLLDDAFNNTDPQNTNPDGDLAGILDAIDSVTPGEPTGGVDALDGNRVVITPDELAAVAGTSIATLGMALNDDVERQLRAIRNRTTTMGVNECVVNEGMPYFNAWVNAEGNRAELDKDGTNAGYQMDSWGGTVGFDVDMTPNFTMGMALTAMYGDITAKGPETKAEGDMDTYYVSLFARYASCAWTHTFVATVGMMDGSMDRTVNIGGHSYTAEGTTDGMTFGLMYEVGYVVPLDEDATACLQPVFNVMLRHSSIGSYTEEGTDAALDVDSQTMTTLTFGLGARMQAVVGESLYNRASIFEARALAKVDLGDRRSKTDVGFVGGSRSAEIQSAELGAFGVELGAGLTIPLGDDDGSIFVDGSAEIRSGYTNLNATVGYRINF